MIELLIEYNAQINTVDDLGKTHLWAAVQKLNPEIAKYLISKGADI